MQKVLILHHFYFMLELLLELLLVLLVLLLVLLYVFHRVHMGRRKGPPSIGGWGA